MVMRSPLFIVVSAIYGLAVAAFTVYWAENFSKYTTYKGDEFFDLVEYLLPAACVFYVLAVFPFKKINFFVALLIPVGACIGAIIAGMLFLLVSRIDGFPRQCILTYGLLYDILTLLAAFMFPWRLFPVGERR